MLPFLPKTNGFCVFQSFWQRFARIGPVCADLDQNGPKLARSCGIVRFRVERPCLELSGRISGILGWSWLFGAIGTHLWHSGLVLAGIGCFELSGLGLGDLVDVGPLWERLGAVRGKGLDCVMFCLVRSRNA